MTDPMDTTNRRVRKIVYEGLREAYGLPAPVPTTGPDGREWYDWDAWGAPTDEDLANCYFAPEYAPLLRALLKTDHSDARDALINAALDRIGRA